MKQLLTRRCVAAGIFLVLFLGTISAQEVTKPATNAQTSSQGAATDSLDAESAPESGNANAGVAQILTKTTEQSAHSAERWGDRLGLNKGVSYAISLAVNFAGIILFFWFILKSNLPKAFRERTATIQKGIREAQEASDDAARRLTDIEARLSRLDADVEEIRRSAEHEAAAEEARVRQAAETDQKRIIEGADAEIQAIARNARRELKGYAASLAVDLAAHRIQVDEPTDHALVREFVGQLGKDGK